MAGIGFEIRKLLKNDTYSSLIRAYGFAGIISSGPWLISILGILILGFMSINRIHPSVQVSQFQTSVTYLIALSLIISGFLQHGFTRYIADTLFAKNVYEVLPNFHGALLLMTLISGVIGLLFVFFFMPSLNLEYRLLMNAGFVLLCDIWVATNLLSGLKAYKAIVWIFFIAYALTIALGFLLRTIGLNGLLFAFVSGQMFLLLGMLIVIYRHYPAKKSISLNFLKPQKMYTSLIWAGFFYNFGIWADKFIFWFSSSTSDAIIGPLRASVIYDLPIFLAYLSIIPGMAIFLVRMETDFVEYYDKFYTAIRDGGSLNQIQYYCNEMISTARRGVFDIIKIQGLAVLLIFVLGKWLLELLGISTLYYHLLCIDVIGVGLQVVFLALLNVYFYLDKRQHALVLTIIFSIFNIAFTSATIHLGAYFFGYGFTLALLLTCAMAMWWLDRAFSSLEYTTFMIAN